MSSQFGIDLRQEVARANRFPVAENHRSNIERSDKTKSRRASSSRMTGFAQQRHFFVQTHAAYLSRAVTTSTNNNADLTMRIASYVQTNAHTFVKSNAPI